MKRFKFRLETVLRVRRVHEEQARGELMRANQALALADARVAERSERYESLERPSGPRAYDEVEKIWFALDAAAGAI